MNKWDKNAELLVSVAETAVNAFPKMNGMQISIHKPQNTADKRSDFIIEFRCANRKPLYYEAEVRFNLHSVALIPNLSKFRDKKMPCLLISSYVSPGVAKSLKKSNIQFIDTVGNAYIENQGIHIYVSANKKPEALIKAKRNSLFQPAGLKFIFACLADAINRGSASKLRKLKEFSRISGISLGSASKIRNEMLERGYLIETDKGFYELRNRKELLEQWSSAFADRLRPKLLLGRYQPLDPQWWRKAELDPEHFLWGGEVAAEKFTKYIFPETITVYSCGSPNSLINRTGLQPHKNGSVEIMGVFWNSGDYRKGDCAHPLLVYADLLAIGEERDIETAKMIFERFMSHEINRI